MNHNDFFKGMGIGLVAGGIFAVSMSMDKRKLKRRKQGAIRVVNEAVDNVTEMLGF